MIVRLWMREMEKNLVRIQAISRHRMNLAVHVVVGKGYGISGYWKIVYVCKTHLIVLFIIL